MSGASASATALARVLQVLRPLVRLLLRHGVSYGALATAMKRLFLEEARADLARRGMPVTDSALTLLSGVHRRDVRTLLRGEAAAARSDAAFQQGAPLSLAAEVVGRWMQDPAYLGLGGEPRVLARGASEATSFDALVASVSRDVRPRALLDELLRLGAAEEVEGGVRLVNPGFAPKQGFDEMTALLAANLHDHAAAAVANVNGEANFLEQAVYVDQLSDASVEQLRRIGKSAWQGAMRQVLGAARVRFEADQALPVDQRRQRARFGVFFYSEPEERLP